MAYDLTSGTKNAAHRRDVAGVVFALTGTLKSLVSGIPDAPFYWSTKELASGGPLSVSHAWEPYLTLPQSVTEELPMEVGQAPPLHNINILVRNLPFREAESLLTAITDQTWEWEGTDASLYAAYQRKGQAAADIPYTDWVTLRLNGQLGGPQNIGTDGFTLPLASREQVRRQYVTVREVTSGDFPNADPREYGKVLSTVYGAPDSWVRARRTDAGIFGLTTDAVVSGTQDYVWVANDAGFDMTQLVGKQVYLYRGDKVLTVASVSAADSSLVTVYFSGGNINFNVPGGSLIQEKMTGGYKFAALNQRLSNGVDGQIRTVGFELMDGTIVPIGALSYSLSQVLDDNGKGRIGSPETSKQRLEVVIDDAVQPPALIPRLNLPSDAVNVVDQPEASITQQPDFDTSEVMSATKSNWPTGPAGASAAFDGNKNTSYGVTGLSSVTFTFPNVTGGYSNSDTTHSTLKFTSAGSFQITDGGITVLANVTGSKGDYTINLGSPEPFNSSVKFISTAAAGGQVYEVEWVHELEKAIDINRTDDVTVATSDVVISSTSEAGYDMVPIKNLVLKANAAHNILDDYALPNYVFEDMQMRFLGEPQTDKDSWRRASTYTAALARYEVNGVALHFVVDRQFTWPELEADVALAAKSYAFYGAQGHEIHYIEDTDTVETVTPVAQFNLPGTPNPNAVQSAGAPLMERTPLSQLVNTVRVYFGRNWMLPRSQDLEERFEAYAEASNAAAVARFGRRYDGKAPIESWPQATGEDYYRIDAANPSRWYNNYTGAYHAGQLAQYLADKFASGATRFTFDTGGEVVGVQRGDIIRVAWSTAVNPSVYRNALCEVESVKQSPQNVNRFTVTCRTVGSVQKGLTNGLIWTDLYTSDADSWADKITGDLDRWEQYWRSS